MKATSKKEDHLGPINPFTLGNTFIEAAQELGWIVAEQEERQRRYFITSKGFEAMAELGMDLQKVLQYRQPASHKEVSAPARSSQRHHADGIGQHGARSRKR